MAHTRERGRQPGKGGEDAWLSHKQLARDGRDRAVGRGRGAELVRRTRIGVLIWRMGGGRCKSREGLRGAIMAAGCGFHYGGWGLVMRGGIRAFSGETTRFKAICVSGAIFAKFG
jgi:hypothetical protein